MKKFVVWIAAGLAVAVALQGMAITAGPQAAALLALLGGFAFACSLPAMLLKPVVPATAAGEATATPPSAFGTALEGLGRDISRFGTDVIAGASAFATTGHAELALD